jgi:hypothetical protein
MNIQQTKQLIKRATVIFPRAEYVEEAAVRYARRQWVRSVAVLRDRPESIWIIDRKVAKCAN